MSPASVVPARSAAQRIDVGPLQRPDHTDYLALLALSISGDQLPDGMGEILAMPPYRAPFTQGPALCLTARLRRSSNPKPVGAVFASFPDWAREHALVQGDPNLSALLCQTAILVYGLAVTPGRRGQGIARALLTEVEGRARSVGYRMATLLHKPELADFYRRLGYTSGHHVTIAMSHAAMGLAQPMPFMTAVKPLHPDVQVREMPGAPGPVVGGLLPGWDLPSHARFEDGRLIA
ncbi:GNAT family N-acetyltransferase [Streptomyces lydicus]|uniref:GNAT family N-acetyltransferase n=1 Tax=Streptomyces lydicus TaxID=47763 RepID=UPI00101177F1|nr:GNAT family N-acetyltransferase [Streptomyces lydicus]MCZ1012004.1 GNAT family N-acetyltransferase [Streptomyces lydicus]